MNNNHLIKSQINNAKIAQGKAEISIQWHITTECNNNCTHCYMFDEATYEQEKNNTLALNDLKEVFKKIEQFENLYPVVFNSITVTGGDPLLRSDAMDFLAFLKEKNRKVSLLGNPEILTDAIVCQLKHIGISGYQLSLDGLEKNHDYVRYQGSFAETLSKIDLLNKYEIPVFIMFTLYPENAEELIPLVKFLVANKKISGFSFDIGSYVGNAKQKEVSTPSIQNLFDQYMELKDTIIKSNPAIHIDEKCNLLKLTKNKNKKFYPIVPETTPFVTGCYVGWRSMSILSDGTVFPCRRIPIAIGKLPEDNLEDIWLNSELLKDFRRPDKFEQCKNCQLIAHCRGCGSNIYGKTNNPQGKYDLCFKDDFINDLTHHTQDYNFKNEWDRFFSRKQFVDRYIEFFADPDFSFIFFELYHCLENRDKFNALGGSFLSNTFNINLNIDQLAWLSTHFGDSPFFIYPNFYDATIHYRSACSHPALTVSQTESNITFKSSNILFSMNIFNRDFIDLICSDNYFTYESMVKLVNHNDAEEFQELLVLLMNNGIIYPLKRAYDQ